MCRWACSAPARPATRASTTTSWTCRKARYDSWVELSSVDTALLMMGVLFAQSYYDGDDPREGDPPDRRHLVQEGGLAVAAAACAADLDGLVPRERLHRPRLDGLQRGDDGLHPCPGSPTHPVSPDAWTVWTRTYDNDWGVYQGQEYLSFGPLFGHQYSHVWIDFRDIQDAYASAAALISSTAARLRWPSANTPSPTRCSGRSMARMWGLTASDGPQNTTQEYRGEQRQFRHYSRAALGCARISMTAPLPRLLRSPRWCLRRSR